MKTERSKVSVAVLAVVVVGIAVAALTDSVAAGVITLIGTLTGLSYRWRAAS